MKNSKETGFVTNEPWSWRPGTIEDRSSLQE